MSTSSIKAHCDELDQTFRQLVEHIEEVEKLTHQLTDQTLEGADRSLDVIIEECQQSIRQVEHNLALLESLWRTLGRTDQLANPGLLKRLAKQFSNTVTIAGIAVSIVSNLAGSTNANYNRNDHLSDSHSMISENNVKKREDQLDQDTIARNQSTSSQ
ncbi:hypothetical protein PN441_13785 [Spirulina major CS-329]|uniref:hypothetical protein n=1 Tax=Spirulina TaxID=1154 RepID=UPI00232B5328|nr:MULTISPECIES: hypothetical protein [Spirulina]MDB9494916.1 hypothetical protein [Spirulina subsalsa CS-330]MDB9504143.1 hypothetical protein [Spirulina major CS-329]